MDREIILGGPDLLENLEKGLGSFWSRRLEGKEFVCQFWRDKLPCFGEGHIAEISGHL